MTKRIVLCADDYGQAYAISQGIITLIKNDRLSATSCMVNSPYWSQTASWLLPFKVQIDIGLHFNLTHGKALSPRYINTYGEDLLSLPVLLGKTFLHQLDQAVLEAECQAQIDKFIELLGFFPDFIDGHQHVQQFPVIRNALMNVYQKNANQKAYMRLSNEKIKMTDLLGDFKKIVIYFTGVRAFKKLLNQYAIPHNQSFAGIYDFKRATQYAQYFPHFLQKIADGGLIMCHPGLISADQEDVIAAARYHEYQYFMSDQFILDCKQQDVILAKF